MTIIPKRAVSKSDQKKFLKNTKTIIAECSFPDIHKQVRIRHGFLDLQFADEKDSAKTLIECSIAPRINRPALLAADHYIQMKNNNKQDTYLNEQTNNSSTKNILGKDESKREKNLNSNKKEAQREMPHQKQSDILRKDTNYTHCETLKRQQEQQKDDTINIFLEEADKAKSKFTLKYGLLFKQDEIHGTKVLQFVTPKSQRKNIIKLIHDQPFGSHSGITRTKQMIRMSNWWPNMSKDITDYIKSCDTCQITYDRTKKDFIPISPIPLPDYPFQVINMDTISINIPSDRKHKYILTIIDLKTRWVEAFPMKTLTAREVCENLKSLFCRFGIPEVITCDQGTNFTADLTQAMINFFGCSSRFATVNHPESSGTIERFNKTLKRRLFSITQEFGKNWDKFLELSLFGHRIVPNAITGYSPDLIQTCE